MCVSHSLSTTFLFIAIFIANCAPSSATAGYIFRQMAQIGYTWGNAEVNKVESAFIVPDPPPNPDKDDQLFYWIGAYRCLGEPENLLQPVIAWNYPGYPFTWTGFAMWILDEKVSRGEIIPANPGDLVSMSITINSSWVDVRVTCRDKTSYLTTPQKQLNGGADTPNLFKMCTANAVVEHGNHVIDPAATFCGVYPPSPVKFRGWVGIGSDGSSATLLQIKYCLDNKITCQMNATWVPWTPGGSIWDLDFYAGIDCGGKRYDRCCGKDPLPECSRDSTSCWVNPFSCKDYANNVCCL